MLNLNGTPGNQVGTQAANAHGQAIGLAGGEVGQAPSGILSKAVVAGERVNLSKAFATATGADIKQWALGLSWNPKPGFKADCDVSVLVCRNGAAIPGTNPVPGAPVNPQTGIAPQISKALCFYGQLELPGLKSYGDNTDGVDGAFATPTRCDEQIDVDLDSIFLPYGGPIEGDEVIIIATTHNEQRDVHGNPNGLPASQLHLGKVGSPMLRVYDNTNPSAPVEKFHFELDEDYSCATAVDVAKFYFKGGTWRYVSMNDVVSDGANLAHAFGLQAILDKFNIG